MCISKSIDKITLIHWSPVHKTVIIRCYWTFPHRFITHIDIQLKIPVRTFPTLRYPITGDLEGAFSVTSRNALAQVTVVGGDWRRGGYVHSIPTVDDAWNRTIAIRGEWNVMWRWLGIQFWILTRWRAAPLPAAHCRYLPIATRTQGLSDWHF